MPRFFVYAASCVIVYAMLLFSGCGEDESNDSISLPEVTTLLVTDITTSTATSGGMIESDGGGKITERGICWSTIPDPTIEDNKATDVSSSENFTIAMEGLTSSTVYYVRAFATNAKGTTYGTSLQFTTGTVTLATVTTVLITKVSIYTAESGGEVTSDGGGTITARGVCWSTHENSTIADSKTIDGEGTDPFVSKVTGLDPRTDYYLRAYVTNEAGTSYGDEMLFTSTDEYSGTYEVVTGSVFRQLPDGSADPVASGDYPVGMTMFIDGFLFGQDTIRLFPAFLTGDVPGIDPTIAIIDRSITSPDGSHPVKIMCPINASLKNIPGTESKFFPGSPSTPGAPVNQELLLNYQWQLAGLLYIRSINNLRLRFKHEGL